MYWKYKKIICCHLMVLKLSFDSYNLIILEQLNDCNAK